MNDDKQGNDMLVLLRQIAPSIPEGNIWSFVVSVSDLVLALQSRGLGSANERTVTETMLRGSHAFPWRVSKIQDDRLLFKPKK